MRIGANLLEAFVLIARLGSFSRASVELGISASSLSDRILSLESLVGFRLFHRTTRRTLVTRHGQDFLIHAQRMLGAVEEMEEAARLIAEAAVGEIVVGAGPYGGLDRDALIERFTARHPGVSVRLAIDPDQSLLFSQLRSGEIDLLFGWGERAGAPLENAYRHEVEIGLIVPDDVDLPDAPALRSADLRGRKLVWPTEALDADAYRSLTAVAAANDIELIELPCEDARELISFARSSRHLIAGCPEYGTPACPIDGVGFRRWSDLPIRATFRLYRDPFCASPLARRFWNEAQGARPMLN